MTIDLLITKASTLRILFFSTGFILFTLFGVIYPFRKATKHNKKRVLNNVSLSIINTVLIKVLQPLNLLALALYCSSNSIGFFNAFKIPTIFEILLSILLLDLTLYLQHLWTHKSSFLWKLHRVHHSDLDFDTSTALRFHPLEILFSLAVKAVAICVLGVSAPAIIAFEILLNFSAMFNHSNFSLFSKIELLLKKIIVTPDMHRVHHSVLVKETNSNYGFFFSFWDKLFNTYLKEPVNSPKNMNIGIEIFRSEDSQSLPQILAQPFKK